MQLHYTDDNLKQLRCSVTSPRRLSCHALNFCMLACQAHWANRVAEQLSKRTMSLFSCRTERLVSAPDTDGASMSWTTVNCKTAIYRESSGYLEIRAPIDRSMSCTTYPRPWLIFSVLCYRSTGFQYVNRRLFFSGWIFGVPDETQNIVLWATTIGACMHFGQFFWNTTPCSSQTSNVLCRCFLESLSKLHKNFTENNIPVQLRKGY